MMRWQKLTAILLALILFSSPVSLFSPVNAQAAETSDSMFDRKAADIVADMGLGWNLGNTMDCFGSYSNKSVSKENYYETLWGNPLATNDLMKQLKAGGFNAVRVPVTWNLHTDADGTIDKAWMDRVEEIVKYVLNNNMYCIINMHHDTGSENIYGGSGWLKANLSDPAMSKRFVTIWKQIAERFKNYDDHLIFEGFNEILIADDKGNAIWGYPGQTSINAVNQLNQLFVDTVRASGGNNVKRHLIVNTYAASTNQSVIDGFELPKDTINNHLIVEVHDYTPIDFAWYADNGDKQRATWGTDSDKAEINAIFNRLYKRFVSQDIPVIVGEFSTNNKNNTSERVKEASYYATTAASKGIVCFWWDSGGKFEVSGNDIYKGPGLINRRTLQWVFPDVLQALKNAALTIKTSISNLTVSPVNNQVYHNKALCPVVTIKNGSELLATGRDYTVTYSSNSAPGKAQIMITGCGKYKGTITDSFLIIPDCTAIKEIGNRKAGSVTLSWKKVKGASGYRISYKESKAGTYRSAGFTHATSNTVKNLKIKKNYYFKITAYVTIDGKKEFGKDSNIKSITIKK